MLSASIRLELPNQHLTIRRVSPAESDEMTAMAKRRNVFARHSWENNFYLERIGLLCDATVLAGSGFDPGRASAYISQAMALYRPQRSSPTV